MTATLVTNADFGGFAELQFYDCTGAQLVPSASSNPDGNQGGTIHPPADAFDGNLVTKWLDINKKPLIATFSTAVRVASYKWITAEGGEYTRRFPASWKLKARPLPSDAWQVLSTVVQHSFTQAHNQVVGPFSLYCAQYPPFLEFAFETTATLVTNEVWGGFAELQFYNCTGAQLVPSAWSNPDGNQGNIASHDPALAFDGNLGTKWLDKNKQLLIATFSTAVRVASYKWITAEGGEFSGRNPASWKLNARLLSSDAWQVLSTVVQHSFNQTTNEVVGPFSLTL
jgi:hypothetical protein